MESWVTFHTHEENQDWTVEILWAWVHVGRGVYEPMPIAATFSMFTPDSAQAALLRWLKRDHTKK